MKKKRKLKKKLSNPKLVNLKKNYFKNNFHKLKNILHKIFLLKVEGYLLKIMKMNMMSK